MSSFCSGIDLLQLHPFLSKLQDAYSDKQLHLWDVAFSADSQQFAVATTHGTFVFSKVGKYGKTQKKTVVACCFLLVLCSVLFCYVVSCCLFAYLVVFVVFPVCLVGGLVGSFLYIHIYIYIGSCFVWCYPLWLWTLGLIFWNNHLVASFGSTTFWVVVDTLNRTLVLLVPKRNEPGIWITLLMFFLVNGDIRKRTDQNWSSCSFMPCRDWRFWTVRMLVWAWRVLLASMAARHASYRRCWRKLCQHLPCLRPDKGWCLLRICAVDVFFLNRFL